MTHTLRTLNAARIVEAFAAGLCLTLAAASVFMAIDAQAAPTSNPDRPAASSRTDSSTSVARDKSTVDVIR